MFSSDVFRNDQPQVNKNKLEIIDKLYSIAEDILYYKAKDIEEELVFVRKVMLRLLKNQKQSLAITLES
jgi:hypothetical protein